MSTPTASTSAAPPEDDGFSAPVTHRKPTRAPKNRKGGNRPRERSLEERVQSRLGAMQSSKYLDKCAELLANALAGTGEGAAGPCPQPEELVCLGLGSVSDSTKSQDQFHLLETLHRTLANDLKGKATVFDPVFAPEDISFFHEHGFEPLTAEHPLTLDRVTLLYMPHCPRSLFNLLLQRNWTPERLRRLVLVGNRLDMYDDPTHPSARSKESTPFITKGAPLFELLPLPPDKRHLESFNDLALQWVSEANLSGLGDDFWQLGQREAAADEAKEAATAEGEGGLAKELEKLSI